MGTRKTCRAVANLTDDQDTAFGLAVEKEQTDESDRLTRQRVLLNLISDFCKKNGVRFPSPSGTKSRKKRAEVQKPGIVSA